MLVPYREILAKSLHKDEIYTSIVLPKKAHDPQDRIKAPHTSFICLGSDSRTYVRDVDNAISAADYHTWTPTAKWIIEKNSPAKANVEESAFRDTYWVKWSEVAALWKMQATEKKMVEQRKESMKEAVITGAKLAIANKGGDIAVNVITDMVPGIKPHMENPAARAIAKLLGAFVLQHTADAVGKEHAELIKTTAGLVATAASMELTSSQLDRLSPAFEQLIALGKKLA